MSEWVALTRVTDPTAEPVSLAEAKTHLRVDTTADDALIASLVVAAREAIEEISGRSLMTQTWDLVFDAFPDAPFTVPRPPLASVTHITYTDKDGNESTFASANYVVDTNSEPGRVALATDAEWPSTTLYPIGAVVVRFVAGYGNAGDVPERYLQALKLVIGHWYENREAIATTGAMPKEMPLAVQALLWMNRVKGF